MENKYKITIYPDYTITGEQYEAAFKDKEELIEFLDGIGYDFTEIAMARVIESGGDYNSLSGKEFTIELIPAEIEQEKNAFNDAELFVSEYKDYLIGKEILIGKEKYGKKKSKIKGIRKEDESVWIFLEDNEDVIDLDKDQFQNFIDGESITTSVDLVQLILQSEPTHEMPENKYFVIDVMNKKILSAFEYKEDAQRDYETKSKFGLDKIALIPKRDLESLGIDPKTPENWNTNEHDWDTITKCINAGVTQGDYSQREADNFVKEFREKGIYVHVIKARLLYCLRKLQDSTWNAFSNSNIERVNERYDESCRIQKELKRVISMEK